MGRRPSSAARGRSASSASCSRFATARLSTRSSACSVPCRWGSASRPLAYNECVLRRAFRIKMGDCFGTGYVLEECHVEEARVARGIEGVRRGDLLEFFARSNDDGCADAEPLDNGPSHEFGHAFNQVRRSVNHYVPALNVGAHSRAADGSEDVPQLHHRQPVLAADIDTAKERDISPFAKCHGPLALSDHAPRTVELSLRVNSGIHILDCAANEPRPRAVPAQRLPGCWWGQSVPNRACPKSPSA